MKQVIKKEKGPAPPPPSLPNVTAAAAPPPAKESVDEKNDASHKVADENDKKPNRNEIIESPVSKTLDDTSNQSEVCLIRLKLKLVFMRISC